MEYEDIKSLPYLEACINEALRMHSTSSMGLPRLMPAQGAEFQGEFFKAGTEVSVPAYTIHVSFTQLSPVVGGDASFSNLADHLQ